MNKMLIIMLAVFTLVSVASVAQAEDYNARLRLHENTAQHGFGVAAWVSVPNVTDTPGNTLAVVGLGHHDEDGTLTELMVGTSIGTVNNMVVDLRAVDSHDLKLFNLDLWANLRWVDVLNPKDSSIYSLVMADVPVFPYLSVGVETENVLVLDRWDTSDFSFGPNVVIDLGVVDLQASVQKHTETANQVWLRTTVDLR